MSWIRWRIKFKFKFKFKTKLTNAVFQTAWKSSFPSSFFRVPSIPVNSEVGTRKFIETQVNKQNGEI